ncbi:MAG TPA: M28 family peptidase [Cyclobacteriaceae bacterium]
MKKLFPFLLIFFTSCSLLAQNNPAKIYADQITQEDLRENLSIIASDALEGRETGKRGQKMAAAFIAAYFQDLGLKGPVNGSHYQEVPLFASSAPTVTLQSGKTTFIADDFVFFGDKETQGSVTLPIVYVGKGSDEDLKDVEVKDKAVLISVAPGVSLMSNPATKMVREKGAKIIIVAMEGPDDFKRLSSMIKNYKGGRLGLKKEEGTTSSTLILTSENAAKLFNTTYDKLAKASASGKVSKVKPGSIIYSVTSNTTEIKSENILGFLEGTDKKDEIVVITAHYDHIGVSHGREGDRINNGADDDGSGTVAVLSLAKTFAQAKKEGKGPRRSILFMTVTGEEKGLLGSEYYSEHPVFPLDQTVVDLNIDMIGRRDPQHKDSAPYVYVIGSDKLSSELHTLSEATNKANVNLVFDYLYNAEEHPDRIYYRSDHWNFARKNVPIIFYFDGIHEDYHAPSDQIDKIEFDLLMKRAQTVFYTAWEIANRETRLVVDKKK